MVDELNERTVRTKSAAAKSTHGSAITLHNPHWVEYEVQHILLAYPNLNFSTLVIHQNNDGVFLDGVLETDVEIPDM